jgi:hypothetical protein
MEAIQEERNKNPFSGAFQPGLVDFNHHPNNRNFGSCSGNLQVAIRLCKSSVTPAHPARQQFQFSTIYTAAHFAKVPANAPPDFYFRWISAAIRE